MIINDRIKTDLKTRDFYYDLPEELIAQHPSAKRDLSRLLVLDRATGSIEDRIFKDVIDYLNEGDTLVINDSKVIPARLYGAKKETGALCEVLLIKQKGADLWECIVRPGRRLKEGAVISFSGIAEGMIESVTDTGNRIVKFDYDRSIGTFYNLLDRIGSTPLPPYITAKLEDKSRYQTVYANKEGSSAAPTAGLHFTPELLVQIEQKGVKIARVMLHVGLGTFRPVKTDDIESHEMHSEYFEITEEAAETINSRRAAGGRTVCVGTTSCRALESAADETGKVHPVSDDTGIFIYPGYKFKAVDALITNFHLPESTLIMLVSAFASRETIMKAYEHAIAEKYRFFSFGDAMLIE